VYKKTTSVHHFSSFQTNTTSKSNNLVFQTKNQTNSKMHSVIAIASAVEDKNGPVVQSGDQCISPSSFMTNFVLGIIM
jgi:hypothetical protein